MGKKFQLPKLRISRETLRRVTGGYAIPDPSVITFRCPPATAPSQDPAICTVSIGNLSLSVDVVCQCHPTKLCF